MDMWKRVSSPSRVVSSKAHGEGTVVTKVTGVDQASLEEGAKEEVATEEVHTER